MTNSPSWKLSLDRSRTDARPLPVAIRLLSLASRAWPVAGSTESKPALRARAAST